MLPRGLPRADHRVAALRWALILPHMGPRIEERTRPVNVLLLLVDVLTKRGWGFLIPQTVLSSMGCCATNRREQPAMLYYDSSRTANDRCFFIPFSIFFLQIVHIMSSVRELFLSKSGFWRPDVSFRSPYAAVHSQGPYEQLPNIGNFFVRFSFFLIPLLVVSSSSFSSIFVFCSYIYLLGKQRLL